MMKSIYIFMLLLLVSISYGADVNVAPLGEATQSSTWNDTVFPAHLAIDGNLGNFTHTAAGDTESWWQVELPKAYEIHTIVLHNRDSCCSSRLRDITVTIYDGEDEVYVSDLLNPENVDNPEGNPWNLGPEMITIELAEAVTGTIVHVDRLYDDDLSGSGGNGNADEGGLLGLGEVQVFVDAATLPPVIDQQPAGGMFFPGGFLGLSVTATGVGMTYQWSKDGEEIDGATAAKLCIYSLAASDSGSYTVVVTNDNGSVESNPAELVVLDGQNIAPLGTATQSSTGWSCPPELALDGNLGNFTHTAAGDTNSWWQLEFAEPVEFGTIILHNRDSCCGSRLRDITVTILNGEDEVFVSDLINPENVDNPEGNPWNLGPEMITIELAEAVTGTIVKVSRLNDDDLSGTGGQGNADEGALLSLGEVWILGDLPLPRPMPNLARCGTATQSTTLGGYVAGLALDGNPGNFTHTLGTDTDPWWQVELPAPVEMNTIVIHNRDDCCGSRLRDITVTILNGEDEVFVSDLLNPENILNETENWAAGPATLTLDLVDLTGGPVTGSIVKVARTPDDDLSGTGGEGNADEISGLGLGEVEIFQACPDQQDAHCTGLDIVGPEGGGVGVYTLTAGGVDDTGDLLTYTFTIDNGETISTFGPQISNTISLKLSYGVHDVSVKVDDSPACPDDAEDSVCTDQIVVAGDPNDVAWGGTATQSTTGWGGEASLAIDGFTDGIYNNGSVTHTAADDPSPWWQVDLGGEFVVERVVLWGRTDECCVDRISNFRLSVLDEAGAEVWGADYHTGTDPRTWVDTTEEIVLPAEIQGNIVKIQSLATEVGTFLNIAEVQVYGALAGLPVFTGDANCDDKIDLSDAICVLTYMFGNVGDNCKEPCCLANNDTNDSGTVDLSDAVRILGYLYTEDALVSPDGDLMRPDSVGCGIYQDVALPCATPCN